MDDVPRGEVFGGAIEREGFCAGEFGVEAQDAVGAVVAISDGDVAWGEEGVCGVEGGEAGGVGKGRGVEEGG